MPALPAPPAQPIRTARLLLRPYCPADTAAFFALLDTERERLQPAFPRRVTTVKTLLDAEQTLQSYDVQWRQRRLLVWGIWCADTHRYLGDISLQPDTVRARLGEIGYYLASAAEGRGYAREALQAVVEYAFRKLGSRLLTLRCRPNNVRSQATAEAVGFRRAMEVQEPDIWYYTLARPITVA